MTTIRQADFIQSIADALQHISYYHPLDYIHALADAYEREQGQRPRTRLRRSSPTRASAPRDTAPSARTPAAWWCS
jgi:hypothetical protein